MGGGGHGTHTTNHCIEIKAVKSSSGSKSDNQQFSAEINHKSGYKGKFW